MYKINSLLFILLVFSFSFNSLFAEDSSAPDTAYCQYDPCPPENIVYPDSSWRNVKDVEIAFNLPYDISGFETGGLFYKVNSTSIATYIPYVQWEEGANCTYNRNFCIHLNEYIEGEIKIWLQDSSAHVNEESSLTFSLPFFDDEPPGIPGVAQTEFNPTNNAKPKITWKKSEDYDSGIKVYHLCIIEYYYTSESVNGQCPLGSDEFIVQNTVSGENISLSIPNELKNNVYSIQIFAEDNARNYSSFSSNFKLIITDGASELEFISKLENQNYGVSPKPETSGLYLFQVRYFDFVNEKAMIHELWLDQNANGKYEDNEKYSLNKDYIDYNIPELDRDNNFENGEIYSLKKNIIYTKENKGLLRYRFYFTNSFGVSIARKIDNSPLLDNILKIDAYSQNFKDEFELRNNYRNSKSTKDLIIILNPKDKYSKIYLTVYSQLGRKIKTLLNGKKYNSSLRFVKWKPKDKFGNSLKSGIYFIQYKSNKSKSNKVLIIEK